MYKKKYKWLNLWIAFRSAKAYIELLEHWDAWNSWMLRFLILRSWIFCFFCPLSHHSVISENPGRAMNPYLRIFIIFLVTRIVALLGLSDLLCCEHFIMWRIPTANTVNYLLHLFSTRILCAQTAQCTGRSSSYRYLICRRMKRYPYPLSDLDWHEWIGFNLFKRDTI